MDINIGDISSAYVTKDGKHKKISKILETVDGINNLVYTKSPYAVVRYLANGGVFDNGKSVNTVEFNKTGGPYTESKIAKTQNVSDDGETADTTTGHERTSFNTVVTIPGAKSLTITITYQTYSIGMVWVALYEEGLTPSSSNYNSSISGKLGGKTKTTKTFTIEGDTVQIYFRSYNASSVVKYYGYYAVVTGTVDNTAVDVVSGEIKEPTNGDLLLGGWFLEEGKTSENKFNLKMDAVNGKLLNVYSKWLTEDEFMLRDFYYTENGDGTYTITSWKGTKDGEDSKELIIPDSSKIVL